LNADSDILAALGSAKVYYRRAAEETKMPFVVVVNSGGMRERITQIYTDMQDTLTIYVEDSKQFRGRDIAEAVLRALENYRGDMSPESDLHIRCGSIRDLDGFQSTFRYIITAYVRYKETTKFPS
jgi:hypothetical protein